MGVSGLGLRNMLFVGDLLQLPPVSGGPVFDKESLLFQLGCAASINIWKNCVTYGELTINERQKNDPQFSSMLDCVRRGCPTEETVRILKARPARGKPSLSKGRDRETGVYLRPVY